MSIKTGLRVLGMAIAAFQAAAGFADAINLSSPTMGFASGPACVSAFELPSGHDNLVDINSAPRAWLVWIGLDEALADKIIGSRPYQARTDLLNRGILRREVYDQVKNRIIARQV